MLTGQARLFQIAAAAIIVLAASALAAAQPAIGPMPIHLQPIEESPTTGSWFTVAMWQRASVRVVIEARHEERDDSAASVPSRLVARALEDGDAPPEWAADVGRVALREWDSYGLTIAARALPQGLAIMWIDLTMDEDDGPSSFRPSAAVLVAWDETASRPSLAESWIGNGPLPRWLRDGLADEVSVAIEAGALDEADRGLAWLDWVGESRAARRLRTSWTRAHDAAERTRRETSIRTAINAGRFDEAERELATLEVDRGARGIVRTLRAALGESRARWFDEFSAGGLHRGMTLAEARTACATSNGSWDANIQGSTAICDFPRGAGAVLAINGAVTVGMNLDEDQVVALSVAWSPSSGAHLSRLRSAVVRSLSSVLGTGSDRASLRHGTAEGLYWQITTRRIVDLTSVSVPAALGVARPFLLTVWFRAER